jgi:hypothetical protein
MNLEPGADAAEIEQGVRSEVESVVLKPDHAWQRSLSGTTMSPVLVALDDVYPDTRIVVVFREVLRPGCLFGFGRRIWGGPDESPGDFTDVFLGNLLVDGREMALSDSTACEARRIIWLLRD